MGFVVLIAMLVLFYAMLIRPQRRQLAAHKALVSGLAEGTEVVTAGGIYGTIRRIDDAVIDLEIAPGTTIRLARNAVTRLVAPEPDALGPRDAPDAPEADL